jgi:hypothetical protein
MKQFQAMSWHPQYMSGILHIEERLVKASRSIILGLEGGEVESSNWGPQEEWRGHRAQTRSDLEDAGCLYFFPESEKWLSPTADTYSQSKLKAEQNGKLFFFFFKFSAIALQMPIFFLRRI